MVKIHWTVEKRAKIMPNPTVETTVVHPGIFIKSWCTFLTLWSYPAVPAASMLFAMVTSLDQMSYCHFLRPITPDKM